MKWYEGRQVNPTYPHKKLSFQQIRDMPVLWRRLLSVDQFVLCATKFILESPMTVLVSSFFNDRLLTLVTNHSCEDAYFMQLLFSHLTDYALKMSGLSVCHLLVVSMYGRGFHR